MRKQCIRNNVKFQLRITATNKEVFHLPTAWKIESYIATKHIPITHQDQRRINTSPIVIKTT